MYRAGGIVCGRAEGAESVGRGDGIGRRLCGSSEVMMMREGEREDR